MDETFLLTTETAEKLYYQYAEKMPIVDYHCHVSPQEIYEDKHFENITGVWLSGDHYKWRLMRSNGVDEAYITGNASDREKFQKFAETLPRAIGNPMYHWCHLELKKYFGYDGILNGNTAEEIWNLTEKKLQEKEMGVRGLIEKSNVAFIGTTDDPLDSLEWHGKLREDKTIQTTVAPSFRPDKALNIEKTGWCDYIKALTEVSGIEINCVEALKKALYMRMEYFKTYGCKSSDHGLDYMMYRTFTPDEIETVFQKGLKKDVLSVEEIEKFKTAMLLFCAEQYYRLGWVMQIHYNCLRNPNTAMLKALGTDTGFDCIGPNNGSYALAKFLDDMNGKGKLPRTILYSLDAGDNAFIDTLTGAFQSPEIPGKIQHGSAWWFNDHKQGMREQMISLANLGILGNFVGMLTDSRSFLSYTRHEYFRRILCGLLGEWVENGEYPNNMDDLGKIVEDICYNNAIRYFNL